MINMNEPKVLTRMRLRCCWGDNLDEKELNEVVDYIDWLQNNWNELKKWCKENQYNDNFDSYQLDNYTTYGVILKKIQELESGDNDR